MKQVWIISAALVAMLLPAAAGGTGGSIPDEFKAKVKDNAVVVAYEGTTAQTAFVFTVYNCPAGHLVTITWNAEQERPSTSQTGTSMYPVSTGDSVQQFLHSSTGGFRPGYDWVGTGIVECGPLTTPVAGSGPTLPVGGSSPYDD